MGLDTVELVMAVEGSFGIDIPNHDAETLATPRLLIDYLETRLPAGGAPSQACLTQRAFYRLRATAARRFDVPKSALTPATRLRPIIRNGKADWKAWRYDVNASNWPVLKSEGFLTKHLGGVESLGDLARHLATYDVSALRDPGSSWTRSEIQALVIALIQTETAVDMSKHTLDSHFVSDMGLA